MKCEILYGPEAGTIKHFANDDATAHTMIHCGALRLVETEPGDMVKMPNGQVIPKMQPAPEPKWYVGMVGAFKPDTIRGAASGDVTRIPAIVFEIGSTTYERFVGDPRDVKKAWHRDVPEAIVAQYTKLHKEHYGK
jgi:hypothetical protein